MIIKRTFMSFIVMGVASIIVIGNTVIISIFFSDTAYEKYVSSFIFGENLEHMTKNASISNFEPVTSIDTINECYEPFLQYITPSEPNSKDIDKSQAIALGIARIEKLFEIDLTNLDIQASFTELLPIRNNQWHVSVSLYKKGVAGADNETGWLYSATIDSLSGDIIEIKRGRLTWKTININEPDLKIILNDNSLIPAAESSITEKLEEIRKIKDVYIDKNGRMGCKDGKMIDNSLDLEQRIVEVVVILEDDSAYKLTMFYPNQLLICVTYYKHLK